MSRPAVIFLVLLVALTVAGCGGDDGEPVSLVGTSWVLTEGVDVTSDGTVSMPTAAFTTDAMTGSGGCNRYSTTYVVDGDEIEIGPVASTQMACPAPADAIEASYFAALQLVARWDVGDDLVLSDAAGDELLRFEPAPAS